MAATRKDRVNGWPAGLCSASTGWNRYLTVPPTPVPNAFATAGVSTTVLVDPGGGSRPASTVARSWLKYSPSRLPFRPLTRKEL